jgi:glycosyltransferase involved in cell wall biosynthesis
MNYYLEYKNSDVIFDFLCFSEKYGSFRKEIEEKGGIILIINKPKFLSLFKYKEIVKRKLIESNYKYKVAHIHELPILNLLSRPFRLYGIKHIIAHSHSVAYSYKFFSKIRNYFFSLGLTNNADFLFSCSFEAAKFWFKNKPYKLIPNAINIEKYIFNEKSRNKIRESLNIYTDSLIGHVGRLSKEKNQTFVIKVFNEYKKRYTNSKLLLIGSGNRNKVYNMIKKFNLIESVIFLNNISNIEDYYNAMDIFIFPSISEGFGISAIEAQANGLPVYLSSQLSPNLNIVNVTYIDLKKGAYFWADSIIKQHCRLKNSHIFFNESSKLEVPKNTPTCIIES